MNNFVDSVHKYISNINIKQALLIDGEWGCGKTHFIKKELMPQNRITQDVPCPLFIKYSYISLFGIDSPKKLMTKINSELLLMFSTDLSERSHILKKRQREIESSYNPSIRKFRTIVGNLATIAQGKFLTDDICQAIFETWNFKFDPNKRYVLIFDDFERAEINIAILMGIINRLVEHTGFRVIIVAHTAELDIIKATAFKTKKEKIIGATLCYKPDPYDTIASIIKSLDNATIEIITFLNNEITAISQICKITNVFNARSIQRAIAVFSQFYDLYSDQLTNVVISAVFRGLVLLVILNDKGYLKEQEFDVFKKYPWDTFILSEPIFLKEMEAENNSCNTNEKPTLSPDEKRKENVVQLIREYPFDTSYPIPESIITYLTAGIWNLDQVKKDCEYLKELTKVINDALSKIVNFRFYEYDNIHQMKAATSSICQNIRDGEYQLNLLYRISRAFEAIEVYNLLSALHIELKDAIIFWKKNTPEEEMYRLHTPLEQHEHRNLSSSEMPEYSDINGILDELFNEIYHKQMLALYEKKSENLNQLFLEEDMYNLLHKPEFIDVLCKNFIANKISLNNVYSLLHNLDPSRRSFYISNAPKHDDNKQIYKNFMRLQSAVNQFTESVDDKLWLYYLDELQKRLQTYINKFPCPSE